MNYSLTISFPQNAQVYPLNFKDCLASTYPFTLQAIKHRLHNPKPHNKSGNLENEICKTAHFLKRQHPKLSYYQATRKLQHIK